MELTCPSCGTKHRTEDYPGAFDIQCVCGYSILVPDVFAFQEGPAPGFITRSPTSEEESETPLRLDLGNSVALQDKEPLFTAPEDLPREMPYDPFEIPQSEPIVEGESVGGFGNLFELPAEPEPTPVAAPKTPAHSNLPPRPPSPPPPPPARPRPVAVEAMTAQALVERSQSASLGQLLGPAFDVQAEGLTREHLVNVAKRCQKLLRHRPWLETELRRRHLDLEKIPDTRSLNNLPEILAIEFYLACIEAGGRCSFRPSPETP